MGGLLYKDFVVIKGKKFVSILIGIILVLGILRLVFPDIPLPDQLLLESDKGHTYNFIEFYLVVFFAFAVFMIMMYIEQVKSSLSYVDRKNKMMNYFLSMPYSKNTYFASKYVFVAILNYISLSFLMIIEVIIASFINGELMRDVLETIATIIIPLISFSLLLTAIDLPLYILLGKEKAQMIKELLLLLIAFFVVGYLMFGDLSWVHLIDYEVITTWFKSHQFFLTLLQIFSPLCCGGLYYLSYRIVCCLGRGEVDINA